MSRTGVEEKPPWSAVPVELKALIGEVLGSPVVRGTRVWGSYGPGPSFRLLLADGRRAFTKALWKDSNEFQVAAFHTELRIYSEMADIISHWAPEQYGTVQHGDWHALLLEDVGPMSAPPWSRSKVRAVTAGLAELHRATAGASMPDWLPRLATMDLTHIQLWQPSVGRDDLERVANLSPQPGEALEWLMTHVPALVEAAVLLPESDTPHSLLHVDVRSDNLRLQRGRLRLFDWPFASVGPHEFDAVAFAQTVEAEGGPGCENVIRWYGENNEVRPEIVTRSVASVSGLFAKLAPQPDIPALPRLRPWQRVQLRVTLRWAAARLGLPDPAWVEGIR